MGDDAISAGSMGDYRSDWCDVDGCPAAICNGPHTSHTCPNGDLVVKRTLDPTPCPFCGWTDTNGGGAEQ